MASRPTRFALRPADDTWTVWPRSWVVVDTVTGLDIAAFSTLEMAAAFMGWLQDSPWG